MQVSLDQDLYRCRKLHSERCGKQPKGCSPIQLGGLAPRLLQFRPLEIRPFHDHPGQPGVRIDVLHSRRLAFQCVRHHTVNAEKTGCLIENGAVAAGKRATVAGIDFRNRPRFKRR